MMWDFFHFTPEIKLFFESCFSDEVCRLEQDESKGLSWSSKKTLLIRRIHTPSPCSFLQNYIYLAVELTKFQISEAFKLARHLINISRISWIFKSKCAFKCFGQIRA